VHIWNYYHILFSYNVDEGKYRQKNNPKGFNNRLKELSIIPIGYARMNCNNLDFLHSFSRYIGNFQVNFFFLYIYTGSTKISAESLLYWKVPSYRHIPIYTSNISHIITQSQPNRLESQSHKHHPHHNHNIYNIHWTTNIIIEE